MSSIEQNFAPAITPIAPPDHNQPSCSNIFPPPTATALQSLEVPVPIPPVEEFMENAAEAKLVIKTEEEDSLKSSYNSSHETAHPPAQEFIPDQPQNRFETFASPQPSKKSKPNSSFCRANVARANALLINVLEEAKPFVFSPDVYNESYLLAAYPKTFVTPQKVDVRESSSNQLIAAIESVVVRDGQPLVIENFHLLSQFDRNLFSLEWLKANKGDVEVAIRDLNLKKDIEMPFSGFLAANEGKPHEEIRYYGKDIHCPEEWHTEAKKILTPYLHYLGPNDVNRKHLINMLTQKVFSPIALKSTI